MSVSLRESEVSGSFPSRKYFSMWQNIRIYFFFQAEDGIRDLTVTGVQTCALPISRAIEGRDGVEEAFLLDEPRDEERRGRARRRPPRIPRHVDRDRMDGGPLRWRSGRDHLLPHLRPFGQKAVARREQPRVGRLPSREERQHGGV